MSDPSAGPLSELDRAGSARIEVGRFVLDTTRRSLTHAGEPVPISATLFDMLLYLVRHPDRIVTKSELLDAVWPTKTVEEANVSQTIFALRKALAASGATEAVIGTAPGQGYRLVAPVRPAEQQAIPADGSVLAPLRPPGAVVRRLPSRSVAGAAGLALVCAAGGTAWLALRPVPAPAAPIPVVLADFQNQTGEPIFDATLQKAVRIDLGQSPRMNVLTSAIVAKTLERMTRPAGTALTGPVAREVCTRNNARAVTEGSIARLGGRYLLTLSATDCSGAKTIADAKETADSREMVVPAIDRLAARVRARLGEAKASIDQFDTPLMPERTASIEALQALTVANDLSVHGKDAEAIPYFQRAIALDPNFARAYAGMAASYYNLNQTDKQIAAITKAYQLRANVDQSLALNIETLYASEATNDYDAVIRASQVMTRLYPRAVSAWVNLANAENWLGRPEEAIPPGRQAVVVGPGNSPSYFVLSLALVHTGRFDEARAVLAKAAAAGLTDNSLDVMRYLLAVAQADDGGVARFAAQVNGKSAEQALLPAFAANAFRLGEIKEAEGDYRRITAFAAAHKTDDAGVLSHARQLAEMGREKDAASLLAKATEAPDPPTYLLAISAFGDPAKARAVLARQLAAGPADTLLNAVWAPQARAYLALRAHQPVVAAAELEKAAPYEGRDTEIPYLRGVAYLAARDGVRAAAAFRKVVDHPGVEPTDAQHALALLGLARAQRLQNDLAGSRRSYEAFLRLWAHADADVPPLVQAKQEYAALGKVR